MPEDAADDELHHLGDGEQQQLLLLEGEGGSEAGPGGGGKRSSQRWVLGNNLQSNLLQNCQPYWIALLISKVIVEEADEGEGMQ